MAAIADIRVDLFRLPLPVAMEASAAGVMTAFDMVGVAITDADGASGYGYTVLHAGQGGSIAACADGPRRSSVFMRSSPSIRGVRMIETEGAAGRASQSVQIVRGPDFPQSWRQVTVVGKAKRAFWP